VRLPSTERLQYVKLLLTTALLVLAFPLFLWHFVAHPHDAGAHLASGGIAGML
jgi:hypothetical protein